MRLQGGNMGMHKTECEKVKETGRSCLERGRAGKRERGRVAAEMRDGGRNVKERQRGNAGKRRCLKKFIKKFQRKKVLKKTVKKIYLKK